jgi:hypothetical protein
MEALEGSVDRQNRVIATEIPDQALLLGLDGLVDADSHVGSRVQIPSINENLVAATDVVGWGTRWGRQARKSTQQQTGNDPKGTSIHPSPPNANEYNGQQQGGYHG